jgi:hypothetical protein
VGGGGGGINIQIGLEAAVKCFEIEEILGNTTGYQFKLRNSKLLKWFDVRGSVRHSTIHKEKSNRMQQCIEIFIIPYLYEAQHVSEDTPPIIRSRRLH